MNTASRMPQCVHLVGSVGLDTVDEVFAVTGKVLGRRLKRVTDGEPGSRRLWVSFQYPLLRANPYLRPDPSGAVRGTSNFALMCLAEGVKPDELTFSELGYAREARASYVDFVAARTAGLIPQGARFQVCLPTPMGVVYAFCSDRDIAAIESAYEKSMLREVAMIRKFIPLEDLCVQWDFCPEMVILDGQSQTMYAPTATSLPQVMARMTRLCAAVPEPVELGIHLCYGDFGGKHFLEPIDAAAMVRVAHGLREAVKRSLSYVHFPVPIERADEAYFKPFADLKLDPSTQIMMGLVHGGDGEEGFRKRYEQALRFTRIDGVATECGISRAKKPAEVRAILELHARISREPAPQSP